YLAAHNPDAFDAMIMYSPNIALGSPTSTLLTMPWGLQLAKAVEGEYRKLIFDTPKASQYWTMEYRTEGIVVVKSLTDMLTTEVFKKVKHPFLVSYWYKNEVESDQVIHIPSVRNFVATASTPEAMKREVPLPDVGSHVMASSLQSKDLDSVREITFAYAEEVLGLQPVPE
ncbi:MAG: alpha/beta hydrolase, partial [Bacteroidota bacterium]